ncbi:MAG: UDP-glucose 6-dehydrogenase, partial [Deltaproteobacteria bacterium]|nr:UDP-glucose 6-dehydrogenase [Deltaproteobacteria bacterium]
MARNITVFGAGYVGLVSGVCLANDGHNVRVIDVDATRIATLNAGQCPFFEPGLDDVMRSGLDSGALSFGLLQDVDTIKDVAMIAVGTPTT